MSTRHTLILTLIVAGCFPLAKRDRFKVAADAYRHHQFEQCYLELDKVTRDDPKYAEARFGSGSCRWEAGDHEHGLALMLEARRLSPHAFEDSQHAKRLAEALAAAGTRWTVTLSRDARELYAAGPVVLAVIDGGDLVAISPVTKTIAWRIPLGSRIDGATARPALDAKRAYVIKIEGSRGTLFAVDLATGEHAWESELGVGYRHATAAVAGDRVYVGAKDAFVALNAETGTEIWRRKLDGSAGSTVVAGDHVCTMTHHGKIVCLATSTGDSMWTYDAGSRASRSRLVARDNRLYFTDDKTVYAIEVGQSHARWEQTFDGVVSSPTVLDTGTIVVATAVSAFALDPDGKRIWEAKLPELLRGGGRHFEATVSTGGLTISSGSGIAMLRATDGQVISVAGFARGPSAPAAAADDTIVTASGHEVVAFALAPW